MICAKCKTENPSEAKFCMSCGSEILPYCPECEIELPAGAEFCHLCGTKLGANPAAHAAVHGAPSVATPERTAAAPDRVTQYIPEELKGKLETARSSGGMEGERRVVTMLFCDVQGSTAAAEQLDPEEWAGIMNGAFEHLIAPVYQYEGTVARLMGDSILAFFGAPIAHEDDPERAILAGLDILKEIQPYRESVKAQWGLDFDVRVGINTGLVVVGAVGSDLLVEYTALGDAVNLAARMEQTAAPGTIQITDNTHRLIAPLFDVEDLGGIEVKGKIDLVQSYRVIKAREERGRLRGIEGLESPLIGREHEMRSMRAAVSELQQGRGQIFSVMGEPGLGKSRLVSELRQALDQESLTGVGPDGAGGNQAPIRWCEGRSLSYETASAYAPFIILLTSCFDLRSQLSDDEKYAVLQAQVQRICGDRESDITPYIASLLGITLPEEVSGRIIYMTPPEMRGHTFKAVAEFIELMAAKQPVILSFEDVHWIDPTSMDLLRELLPITDRAALMIIGAFRPWRNEPSWELHELASRDYGHRYNSIMLSPLNGEQARELVGNLLEVDDLPQSVRTLILARAEGNPFYVEEVIRSLLDAGLVVREGDHWKATAEIESISVPSTLAGVITARFDQLSDTAKQVAQSAAVIGREFSFDALADLSQEGGLLDEILTDLQRREMIRETRRVPQRVYMFKHALTQETVYNTLLLSKRRELHRRLAECYERLAPDGVNAIARHFTEAGELGRALPYVVSSGERAAGAYATAEAIGYFNQALEILKDHDDIELARRVYEGLGGAQTFGGDAEGALATYAQMREIADAAGAVEMQVSAYNKLAFVSGLVLGDVDKAEALLEKSSKMADSVSDFGGLAEYHLTECYLRTSSGDLEGARDHQMEAQQLGDDQGFEAVRLFGLSHYANTLAYMADFDESLKAAEIAKKAAEEFGNQQYLAEVMGHILPLNHMRNGDLKLAYDVSAEGLKIAQEIGASQEISKAAFTHGMVASMRGLYEEAIRMHSLSDSTAVAAGMYFLEMPAKCSLGTAYADISPKLMDKAAELHRAANEARKKPLGNAFGSLASAEMGFREMKAGNLDEAQCYFEQGMTEASAAKYLARPALLLGSGFVKMMQGEPAEADRLFKEGRAFAEQRGMKHFYPVIEFAEANLLMVQEDISEALHAFMRGETAASEMGAEPWVWQNQAGAARALTALGRSDDAAAKRSEAERSIERIGEHFEDEELKNHFLEYATSSLA